MFSLNWSNSDIKIFVITVNGFKHAISCVRDQDATTAPARHTLETGSLNWAQFMLLRFIRWSEFNESSAPFRKNSNEKSKWTKSNSAEYGKYVLCRKIHSKFRLILNLPNDSSNNVHCKMLQNAMKIYSTS